MKKFISFTLVALLLLSTLTGCASNTNNTTPNTEDTQNGIQTYGPNAWDGSIASSFDGGDGSEGDPYRIATAEQLAFLASEINSGTSYQGKHFILTSHIDLANIQWTPIGTIKHPFDGCFNGQGHTISNLNLDPPFSNVSSGYDIGAGGLFGYVKNVCISNLTIKNANITINELRKYDTIKIGILAANMQINTKCDIHNIKILNASINAKKVNLLPLQSHMYFNVGGITGYCSIEKTATCNIYNVHSDINVSMDDYVVENRVGAIIGVLINQNKITMSNIASYLSIKWADTGIQPAGSNLAGAVGSTSVWDNSNTIISNIYSSVTTNKQSAKEIGALTLDDFYRVNAIFGEASNSTGANAIYELTNAFGHVKPSNEGADFSQTYYTLYSSFKNDKHAETNCQGCDTLPNNHCFDTDIWDVSNPAKPMLK